MLKGKLAAMPRKTSRKLTAVSLALDEDVLKEVDALAAQQDRSRGQMVRWLALCELERRRMARATTEPPPSGEGAAA